MERNHAQPKTALILDAIPIDDHASSSEEVTTPIESSTHASMRDEIVIIGRISNDLPGTGEGSSSQVIMEAIPLTDQDAATSSSNVVALMPVRGRSIPFRIAHFIASSSAWCFGVASLILGLAIFASVPLLQLVSFGYLLEVSGKIVRTGKVRSALSGVRKASRLGGIVMGTWLVLLPLRYLSIQSYAASLIDPTSNQTAALQVGQLVVGWFTLLHVVTAWFAGGKLRHFFWPIIAPFSLTVWVGRSLLGIPAMRNVLNQTVGRVFPRLVDDLCYVESLTDWFVPAILLKSIWSGDGWQRMRDGVWDFLVGLRIPYYFGLGLRGAAGTLLWLLIPTAILVIGAQFGPAIGGLSLLFSGALMIVVTVYLPFLQAEFAATGEFSAFYQISRTRYAFRRSPLRFWLALTFALILALPLFFFKIERFLPHLDWLLTFFFVMLMLPARIAVGWAMARGKRREKPTWLIWRWFFRGMEIPIALVFTFFAVLSRYTSWYGGWSLLEHPAFMAPAPFFEWPF
jgi:hypothetical protein